MNMRDKLIDAMDGSLMYPRAGDDGRSGWEIALDAALDVMMDPANWTDELRDAADHRKLVKSDGGFEIIKTSRQEKFRAVIKAIKEGK